MNIKTPTISIIKTLILSGILLFVISFAVAAPPPPNDPMPDGNNSALIPWHQSITGQYKAGNLSLGAQEAPREGVVLDVWGRSQVSGTVFVNNDAVISDTTTAGGSRPSAYAMYVQGHASISGLMSAGVQRVCADNNGVLFVGTGPNGEDCNALHQEYEEGAVDKEPEVNCSESPKHSTCVTQDPNPTEEEQPGEIAETEIPSPVDCERFPAAKQCSGTGEGTQNETSDGLCVPGELVGECRSDPSSVPSICNPLFESDCEVVSCEENTTRETCESSTSGTRTSLFRIEQQKCGWFEEICADPEDTSVTPPETAEPSEIAEQGGNTTDPRDPSIYKPPTPPAP